MTPARHQYSDEAKRDLADIRIYLKNQAGDAVAARMISRLKSAIANVRRMPRAGVARPEYRPNCRFVVEKPYLVYYDFDGRLVLILRIIHQAQDRDAIMGGA